MAAALPTVTVFSTSGSQDGSVVVPAVLKAPIRPDVVQQVFTGLNKNKRQPYAVNVEAGHQTSAISWGTGRAVARIPRVSGGGTHRAGQAAFGNMCRGGRMFAPTKTWRKWHVKISQGQRRYATASALAASAVAPLVMARGHKIDKIAEVPLVVSDAVEALEKTKDALALLKALKADVDVEKVVNSKKLRAGKGKLRNRRHKQRRGPLVIYNEDKGLVKAFRNIPGVETASVNSLNLLQLAPGGHLGRFCIWTKSAIEKLDKVFGTTVKPSEVKKGFVLPTAVMSVPDVARVINSEEVQAVLRPAGEKKQKRPHTQRKNPLKNRAVLIRLNPYAAVPRRADIKTHKKVAEGKAAGKKARDAKVAKKRSVGFQETLFAP